MEKHPRKKTDSQIFPSPANQSVGTNKPNLFSLTADVIVFLF